MRIKVKSMVITGFHEGEKLFVTVQWDEVGEATPHRRHRATSFEVPKQVTIEDIGRILVEKVKGRDYSEEKKKLYEQLKTHFEGNFEAIQKAIEEASKVIYGWETTSLFTLPDYKWREFKDYMEKVILRREK